VHYKKGRMHGSKTWWLPDGRISRVLSYHHGQLHGTTMEWDFRKNWKIRRQYRHGRKHGREIWWLSHGWRSVKEFREGVQHGVSQLWYPNRRQYSQARYHKGRVCGVMQCFLPNGTPKRCPYFMLVHQPDCRQTPTGASCAPCPTS
jgi:antitoxin component YwqK of YwqJK toxin-antitoxin module